MTGAITVVPGVEQSIEFNMPENYNGQKRDVNDVSDKVRNGVARKLRIKKVACVACAIIGVMGIISTLLLIMYFDPKFTWSNIVINIWVAAVFGSVAIGLISAVFSMALANNLGWIDGN